MREEQLREFMDACKKIIEGSYAQNQDDPEYDVPIVTGLITENTVDPNPDVLGVVPLPPMPSKELTTLLIRKLLADREGWPAPIHGVLMIFPGYQLDSAENRKREREIALATVETDAGQFANILYAVERKEGKTICTFEGEHIEQGPVDPTEVGGMQGFFTDFIKQQTRQ